MVAAQTYVTHRVFGGRTALHQASYAFHSDDQHDVIHALCQAEDIDVDAKENSGGTALRRIAGFPPMPNNVRALLACKADPNIQDASGISALEAAEAECPEDCPPLEDVLGQSCVEVCKMLRDACQ